MPIGEWAKLHKAKLEHPDPKLALRRCVVMRQVALQQPQGQGEPHGCIAVELGSGGFYVMGLVFKDEQVCGECLEYFLAMPSKQGSCFGLHTVVYPQIKAHLDQGAPCKSRYLQVACLDRSWGGVDSC
jgi:hypothetical protein